MRKAMILFALMLSSCANPEVIAERQDAYCASIGAPAGSPNYTQCRLVVEQQRQNQQAVNLNLIATGLATASGR